MTSRDPLEQRKHVPTIPDDLNDPPRFSQMVETAQDALVLELRHYLETQNFRTDQRQEIPTIEKYAIGFGTGLDPYQTFVKIVAEYPDVTERLPHIAVTTISGQNKRMTTGRPLIASTQLAPRVTTTNPEPYALADATPQVTTITVLTLPVAPTEYTVVVNGEFVTVLMAAGSTASNIIAALARAVQSSLINFVLSVASTPGTSPALTLTGRDLGVSYAISTSPNLGVTTQAAGGATAPDVLVLKTQYEHEPPHISRIQFPAARFQTTENLAALDASSVARVFNEQALYLTALEVPVGVGTGLQIQIGGRLFASMPNLVEVLAESTPNIVAQLGLAVTGTGALGDSITGVAPDMTLNVAGASFTAALIGRNVTLGDRSYPITAVAGPTALSFTASDVTPGPFTSDYFIGARDDSTNPARPVMNRYHIAMGMSVTLDILAESPNERREILDLILALFMFEMEIKHFTIYGRGVFDPDTYPDEHYQISIAQEVNDGGQQEHPRSEDQKNKIYSARIIVPLTIIWYVDRQVLVPSGPSQGQSWTLESENITEDPNLPMSS